MLLHRLGKGLVEHGQCLVDIGLIDHQGRDEPHDVGAGIDQQQALRQSGVERRLDRPTWMPRAAPTAHLADAL